MGISSKPSYFSLILDNSFGDEQAHMTIHTALLQELHFHTFKNFEPLSKPRYHAHSRGRIVFSSRELTMMQSPTARLNDVCINGIATLLLHQFSDTMRRTSASSQQCALFSTFDLPMMRYNASDTEIWRQTQHTEYWACKIWVLPIHRPQSEHWVMSTIIPSTGKIHLFDSFGQKTPWELEVKVSITHL